MYDFKIQPNAYKEDNDMQCTSYHNFLHKKNPYLHALQGNGEMGARYLDPKYSRWISVDPALSDFVSGNSNGSSGGIYNPTNLNLYHYGNNNPIKYIDPDGRETIPLLSQKFGDYDYIPRIESIDTGNQYVDEFLGGLAFWWNLFAGCGAVITNGIGAGFELKDSVINFFDEHIPFELTLTGNGFRQDLYAIEMITAANPQLISEIFNAVPDVLNYLWGCHSENEKIKYIGSLISNGKQNGRNIEYQLDNNTKLMFRKDAGEHAHSIGPKYPNPTDHYNIEIQKYSKKNHKMQTVKSYHIIIDKNNNIIDYF